jgi:hypothetical protein
MGTLFAPSLLLLLVAADAGPAPKFPVGPETTVATGPLDAEGHIDYEAALNERLGKGITPETNANVLLWKALGPKPEGATMPPAFFKFLGAAEPPEKGDYFVSLGKYLKEHLKLNQDEFETIFDQQSRASARPWKAEDFPHVAAWLIVNEKPLAVVVEATKRPDYFNPMASRRGEKDPSNLISCLLPAIQKCRELTTALTARAMLRIKEGKYDEAWQDILACHRLGRLVGRGATLIELLVGIAIDAIASDREIVYLETAKLTSKQVLARLEDLKALPPLSTAADKVDLGERFMYLDCVQLVRRGGAKMLEGLANDTLPDEVKDPNVQAALAAMDWGPAMREGNRWYDRFSAAMRLKDRAAREKEFTRLEKDLKELKTAALDPDKFLKRLQAGAPADAEVSRAVGRVLVAMLIPAVRKVQSARDRAEQIDRNLHTAYALAAYRKDNGRYPAKLEDLAPKYLAAVPGDIFSGKALIYKPAEKGYLLYSVGANGIDEEGRWYDDEPRGDDPRVRVPLPELKPRQ